EWSFMQKQLSRRPATEADLPFLFALRMESMDPHIAAAGIPLTSAQHMERVRDKLDSAEVLVVDDAPAGMIKIDREGAYWHIMQLQVVPALHRSGVGSEILRQVIAAARQAQAQLTLGVLKVNPVQRLYARLGFVVSGESALEYEMVWRGTDAGLLSELSERERALHAACVGGDTACVSALVHEDFREFGRSGKTWDKALLLAALEGGAAPEFHAQDFAICSRTATSCLLTFRSADVGANGALERHALRSSLWKHEAGTWQLVFHQGTATAAFSRTSD
ncbi:MAG: GNAT family N-acetyltransferase, partial [Betaproteobacteria bacterium]